MLWRDVVYSEDSYCGGSGAGAMKMSCVES